MKHFIQNIGCWEDRADWWNPTNRAIPSVEGTNEKLQDNYRTRKDPIGMFLFLFCFL